MLFSKCVHFETTRLGDLDGSNYLSSLRFGDFCLTNQISVCWLLQRNAGMTFCGVLKETSTSSVVKSHILLWENRLYVDVSCSMSNFSSAGFNKECFLSESDLDVIVKFKYSWPDFRNMLSFPRWWTQRSCGAAFLQKLFDHNFLPALNLNRC